MPAVKPAITKRGSALPPVLVSTPNPLAAVNPNPAGNRNTVLPKPGAVLPFVNPNKPQVDLAKPSTSTLPPTRSVTGGVTAGDINIQPGQVAAPPAAPVETTIAASPPSEDPQGDSGYKNSAGTVITNAELAAMQRAQQNGKSALDDYIARGFVIPPSSKEEEMDPEFKALLDNQPVGFDSNRFGSALDMTIALYLGKHKGADINKLRAQASKYLSDKAEADLRGKEATATDVEFRGLLTKIFGADQMKVPSAVATALERMTPQDIQGYVNDPKNLITPEEYRKLRHYWESKHSELWPSASGSTPAGIVDKQTDLFTGKGGGPPVNPDTTQEMAVWQATLYEAEHKPVPTDRGELELWLATGPLAPPPGIYQQPGGAWYDTTTSDGSVLGDRLAAVQAYQSYLAGRANLQEIAGARMGQFLKAESAAADLAAEQKAYDEANKNDDFVSVVEHAANMRKLEEQASRAATAKIGFDIMAEMMQSPGMLMRFQASGMLDKINKDFGLNLKVPARKSQQDVLAMLPSMGNLSSMSYDQIIEAATSLFWSTGWSPEEIIALITQVKTAPGGQGGSVSESTAKRS